METCFSETSADIQEATRRCFPEYRTLLNSALFRTHSESGHIRWYASNKHTTNFPTLARSEVNQLNNFCLHSKGTASTVYRLYWTNRPYFSMVSRTPAVMHNSARKINYILWGEKSAPTSTFLFINTVGWGGSIWFSTVSLHPCSTYVLEWHLSSPHVFRLKKTQIYVTISNQIWYLCVTF